MAQLEGGNGSGGVVAIEATAPDVLAEGEGRPESRNRLGQRRKLFVSTGIGALVLGLALWYVGPWLRNYFAHVETDDAFVAGHMTAVAARISDVVEQVLVDDNDQVEKGTLLVLLDPEPFRVQVEEKRAALRSQTLLVAQMIKAVEADRAALDDARLKVAAALAGLEEAWKGVEGRQEQVRYRIASLHAAAATTRATQAEVVLAEKDHDRLKNLVSRQSATTAELDQRWATLVSAREKVKAGEQLVQEARAQLALAPDYQNPERVPADLERTDTEVRRAVAAGQQILASLGVDFSRDLDPVEFAKSVKGLKARGASGWVDHVPMVQAARCKLETSIAAIGGADYDPAHPEQHPNVVRVQKELDEALLHLGYTEIRAPVSGFVNRRAIHPGDHVQAGQALLAVQPLNDVYVVANFKETQLADLHIGQQVAIHVDAYPGRPVAGRISGFAPATGAASSLLPPENATGNYVKVVQRVPVRIDLTELNPVESPLFVGMSVIPVVDIKAPATGPDAGARLRSRHTTAGVVREARR